MTRTRKTLTLLGAALLCGASLGADETLAWRATSRESLGASLNPLGLQNVLAREWQRPLTSSRRPLLSDAHWSFGVESRVTPAYARVGAWAELAPLSILKLRAGIEPAGYFGTFKSLLAFDGYDSRFDDDARRERGGEARAAFAGRAYLAPTLQLKAGHLAFRARAELEWWKAQIAGPYFYEPARDTLLKAHGDAMMTGESILVYELASSPGRKTLVGVVHDLTLVYAARQNRKQDVGVLAILGLGKRLFGMRELTLQAKVVRYVEDPNRENQIGAQLGIGFELGKAR